MDFLSLIRCSYLSSADRPDGFVGNDAAPHLLCCNRFKRTVKLFLDHLQCLARLSLLQQFSEANDGYKAGRQSRLQLLVDVCIGLTQDVSSLTMPKNHIAAAKVENHLGTNLTSKGSRSFVINILSADTDL